VTVAVDADIMNFSYCEPARGPTSRNGERFVPCHGRYRAVEHFTVQPKTLWLSGILAQRYTCGNERKTFFAKILSAEIFPLQWEAQMSRELCNFMMMSVIKAI
jgi:hypothetical protein